MQIRFLSFTKGIPHDLASNSIPELELNCKSLNDSEITMEVMGSYLLMIVTYKIRRRLSSRHQRIYFVDWIKGHIHCVSLQGNNFRWTFIVMAGSACS
jgi:hypothetical protein